MCKRHIRRGIAFLAYQIGFIDVIQAFFFPADPVFYLVIFIVLLSIYLNWLYLAKKESWRQPWLRRYRWVIVAAFIIPLTAVFLITGTSQVGAGWQLENDHLKIKTAAAPARLDLGKTSILLAASPGPWQPAKRTNGYGTPGLTTGWCKLQNGKEAVVFRHLQSASVVVLVSEGRYYVLAHPGVEELYHRLTARGVKHESL